MSSSYDEVISFGPNLSRQQRDRELKKVQAIEGVLNDMFTSFRIKMRHGAVSEEHAFKTSIYKAVEAYVNENLWLIEEDT
jgi:hypothetical protein